MVYSSKPLSLRESGSIGATAASPACDGHPDRDAARVSPFRMQKRPTRRAYGKSGGGAIFRVLRRLWIPLVLLAVIGIGALTVSRLHGVFGSENRPSYADTNVNDSPSLDPTELTYQVFGAPGTVADISYFDAKGEPQLVRQTSLPWTFKFTTASAAIASVVAQGDSGTIGCRIMVDGAVKAEKVTNEPSAFTFCLLKPS